jgi:uncharacterized protein (TIGR02453 family)
MKSTLGFLKDLSANNQRDWFQANKKTYDQSRAEIIQLCTDVILQLSSHDPDVAEINPTKAIYRIYRDTRFSANKTPYKNNLGFWLSPGNKKEAIAGYYVHIQPSESFVAAGIYMPQSPELNAIRQEINFNFSELRKILEEKSFLSTWGDLMDDQLKSMPRGFEKDHPAADLLKYKSFVVSKRFSDKEVSSPQFVKQISETLAIGIPLVRFINEAISLSKD